MAGFEVEADKNGETISVVHENLLGEVKKRPDVKPLLLIKGFPLNVEVSFGKPIDNAKQLLPAAQKAAEELQKAVLEEFDSLVQELARLQEAEKKGDDKAADKADKAIKKAEKELKSLAGEAGTRIRKAVERELKALKSPVKALATSRTVFRGFELRDEAFEGSAEEDEEEIDPSAGGYIKTLAKSSDEAEAEAKEEARLRKELLKAIQEANSQAAKASGGGKQALEMEEFARSNPKIVKQVEDRLTDYTDQLLALVKTLAKAHKPQQALIKLRDKDPKLAGNKDFVDALKRHVEAGGKFEALVEELRKEARSGLEDLFRGEYQRGKRLDEAVKRLERVPDTTAAAKELAKATAELEKCLKG